MLTNMAIMATRLALFIPLQFSAHLSRFSAHLSRLSILFCAALLLWSCEPPKDGAPAPDGERDGDREYRASKTAPPQVALQAKLLSDQRLQVGVAVPKEHHIYLDQGVEGNLLPISFDWRPHIEKRLLLQEPRLAAAPPGQKDEKVKATVLRGEGNFLFEAAGLERLSGKELRVRIQICDEIRGICFRPEWKEVPIL